MASDVQQKINSFCLKGLTCAPVTPFTDSGEVNYALIDDYVNHLVKYGIRNVFVTGTCGESNNMHIEERKRVVEKWISASRGRLSAVMAMIGAGCLADTETLARHAQETGADAIACVSPTYYKPDSIDSYVGYMQRVAAAAPNLPFYLYDIDFVTGVKISAVEFFEAALPRIPTLRGVKHTTASFPSMHTLTSRFGDRIQVLQGSDETYLEGLAIGIEGNVMNSYLGLVLNRVKEAFDKGDFETARREQFLAVQVGNIARKHAPNIPAFPKAILKLLGLDAGPPRLPLTAISGNELNRLRDELTKIGFFDWAVAE